MKFTNMKRKGLIIGGLCIALSAAGITFALLSTSSQTNENRFGGAYAKVNIAVIENEKQHEDETNKEELYPVIMENETIRKIVKIENVNDPSYPTTDTFVRVKIIPQLIDSEGNTIGQSVNVDLNLNRQSENWVYDNQDDVYYYTKTVAPGEQTEILLESVTLKQKLSDNQKLQVNVLADAISAHPETNLESVWKLTNNNGNYFSGFESIK